MDTALPDRRPKGRTLHACQQCRALKARCLPSSQAGVCQKCLKAQKPCTFAEQQPRQGRGRARPSVSRVGKLESKLDGLIALLGSPREKLDQNSLLLLEVDQEPNAGLQNNISTSHALEEAVNGQDYSRGNTALPFNVSPGINDQWYFPDTERNTGEVLSSGGLLSVDKAEQLLHSYHDMMSYYPFVVLPPIRSALSFAQDRPFLFLAIVTAASSADRALQQALDKEFRSVLSQRIIMEGEKSIDLLQGLLVYLAWYHFHYVPGRQQFYQVLNLAVAMVVDLGLNQTPREAKSQKVGLDLSHHFNGSTGWSNDEFYEREARRAYLGCYHLCTTVQLGHPRLSILKSTDYMTQCSESLQKDMEFETDTLLPYLLRLSRLAEDINATYHFQSKGNQTDIEQVRLQAHVQSFQVQLQDWKNSLPVVARQNSLLITSYHYVNMIIHETGLVSARPNTDSNYPLLDGPKLSIRLNNLFTCLDATRSYFSTFLLLPPSIHPLLSFSEWCRLIHVTFTMYRLSTRAPVPEWDFRSVRETVRFEFYLEALCDRLQAVPDCGTGVRSRDLYSRYKTVFEDVRSTYLRLKEQPFQSVDDGPAHQAFSADQKRPRASSAQSGLGGRCPFLYGMSKATQSNEGNRVEDRYHSYTCNTELLENQAFLDNMIAESGHGLDFGTFGAQEQDLQLTSMMPTAMLQDDGRCPGAIHTTPHHPGLRFRNNAS